MLHLLKNYAVNMITMNSTIVTVAQHSRRESTPASAAFKVYWLCCVAQTLYQAQNQWLEAIDCG